MPPFAAIRPGALLSAPRLPLLASLRPRRRALPSTAPARSLAAGRPRDKAAEPADTGAMPVDDAIAGGGSGAKGRTGGGPPLSSSSPNAPARPSVFNSRVMGSGENGPEEELTPEQRREIDEHNAHFQHEHHRSQGAAPDKIHHRFWGSGTDKPKSAGQ